MGVIGRHAPESVPDNRHSCLCSALQECLVLDAAMQRQALVAIARFR